MATNRIIFLLLSLGSAGAFSSTLLKEGFDSKQFISIQNTYIKNHHLRLSDEKSLIKRDQDSRQNSSKEELEFIYSREDIDKVLSNSSLEEKEDPIITLKILADKQYDYDQNIFIAEGNAKAIINGGILRSNLIKFDRNSELLIAEGDVSLERGNQFLRAEKLMYNFSKKEGKLIKVYGVIDVKHLNNDFDIISSLKEPDNIKNRSLSNNELPINFSDSYQIKFGSLNYNVNRITQINNAGKSINSWRIKSPLVIINEKGWEAREMIFSNDPFNPTQLDIKAINVSAINDESGFVIITSSRSFLTIDKRLTIPIGSQNFGSSKEDQSSWGFGFDFKDRDGFFVYRKNEPLKISKDIKLKFEPQILFNRALIGGTNSYIKNGSNVTSGKVFSKTSILDLLGLEFNIEGKINNWKLNIDNNLSTFNPQRIFNGFRSSANIVKKFNIDKSSQFNVNLFTAYRYPAWNGSLGETEINSAIGGFVEKKGGWRAGKLNNNYNIRLGLANYKAEEITNRNLISMLRTSLFGSINSEYNLWRGNYSELSQEAAFLNSPVPIVPKATFKTSLSSSYFYYADGNKQASVMISAGPELRLGNLTRNFLDYTRISILPSYKIKSGSSPFKFDKAIDLMTLNVDLTQQIYGPLMIQTDFNLNLEKENKNYLKIFGSKFSLLIQRRAYEFGLFYNPNQESIGISFRLNGFNSIDLNQEIF